MLNTSGRKVINKINQALIQNLDHVDVPCYTNVIHLLKSFVRYQIILSYRTVMVNSVPHFRIFFLIYRNRPLMRKIILHSKPSRIVTLKAGKLARAPFYNRGILTLLSHPDYKYLSLHDAKIAGIGGIVVCSIFF